MAIDRNDFTQKRPGLKPEMIGSATRAVLTVEKVEQVKLTDNGEDRNALALTFAEFPDHAYWPNGTSIGYLIDKLGEEETRWKGKRVPLVKVKANNPRLNKIQDSLWVAEPENWDEFLRGGSATKKAVKKSAARR